MKIGAAGVNSSWITWRLRFCAGLNVFSCKHDFMVLFCWSGWYSIAIHSPYFPKQPSVKIPLPDIQVDKALILPSSTQVNKALIFLQKTQRKNAKKKCKEKIKNRVDKWKCFMYNGLCAWQQICWKCYHMETMNSEKYSRGRRGAPAKGVGRVTGARVQIPLSPLFFPNDYFFDLMKSRKINKKLLDRQGKLCYD